MKECSTRAQNTLIYLLAFVCAIGNPVVLPSLPFIMREFELSALETGLIISVYALPGIGVIPLYGVLSDRIGRRPLLLAGLALCGAGSLLCYAAPGFSWLLAGRALQGLSLTPLEAMCNTLISDLYEGEARMRFVTKATAMQYFSIAVTPLMVSWLLTLGSWRLSLLAAAALCFGALLFCLPMRLPYRPSRSVSLALYAAHIKSILASPRVLSLFSVRLGAALILFGAIYPHISLLAEEKRKFNLENLIKRLAETVFRYYITYLNSADALLAEWRGANRLIGRRISVTDSCGGTHDGIFRAISADGSMIFEENGQVKYFTCGDVKINRESVDWNHLT